jgi:phenylalanine-4-hydroxylase
MALLSRLHWWTVEYGLIGTLEEPKIYGAGLLSSIGESANCMKPEVEKLWYTIDAINYPFDITKEQPQLFVTPAFQNLVDVLEQFADTMAFRKGSLEGLNKAIECKNICTAVYSSGLQVTGVFTGVKTDNEGNVTHIKTTGSSALSYNNKQLKGHDKQHHKDGFSSPVGKLKGSNMLLEDVSIHELPTVGIKQFKESVLNFKSGITVRGSVTDVTTKNGKLLTITFINCTVHDEQGIIYFQPEWGTYDMAVGDKIVSVFCGAADKNAFNETSIIPRTKTYRHHYTEEEQEYQQLFKTVRNCREQHKGFEKLPEVWSELEHAFPDDWLCSLEILELLNQENLYADTMQEIRNYLQQKASKEQQYNKLINAGFYLIEHPVKELQAI